MIPTLCGAFFVSGCSALIFEALWFRQAGLAFGNSVWASSLVLAGAALVLGLPAMGGALPTSPFWTWLDGLCQVLPPRHDTSSARLARH